MSNQLIQGDCLEVMRGLPDQSIGLVLADLPYGVTACHWDTVIDLAAMWVQLKRLIQPKRACVFTATQPFTTDLICSNRDWFKYCWVWEKSKPNGWQHAKNKPMQSTEDVLVFSRAAISHDKNRMFYTPQGIKSIGMSKLRESAHGKSMGARPNQVGAIYEAYTGFPDNILRFSNIVGTSAIHPTQKPVALFEYLIRTYTNPGAVVLDPTAGSMTTAIACLNTGRGYICIEKDPDEYRKGLARVEAHLAKPQQFNLLEPTPALPARATVEQATIFDALETSA